MEMLALSARRQLLAKATSLFPRCKTRKFGSSSARLAVPHHPAFVSAQNKRLDPIYRPKDAQPTGHASKKADAGKVAFNMDVCCRHGIVKTDPATGTRIFQEITRAKPTETSVKAVAESMLWRTTFSSQRLTLTQNTQSTFRSFPRLAVS